ncbi:MAG: D-alanine--D-alanine ligase [Congregibacter sp.]
MSRQPEMKSRRVGVLYGGHSGEREVSIASSRTVLATLREAGYKTVAIDTAESSWWDALQNIELAFNILHGPGGEDGVIQGLLASMQVPATGSGVLGSALAMDKLRSKQIWRSLGLPTADFVLVDADTDGAALLADWQKAFIKPAREGSSLGMACVSTPAEFEQAVNKAREHDSRVMAERFVDGPEYTVAVLGGRTLPAIRIESAHDFYDYDAKYAVDTTRYHIPCGLSESEEAQLSTLALQAFNALDCAVWGRVDVMRDHGGEFHLLEVNTIPGMTSHSLVPMAARAAGISLADLLEEIMELSLMQVNEEQRGDR